MSTNQASVEKKPMDSRPEGVYCHWETYPPEAPMIRDNILVIEHVWGDGSVTRFQCAREEADVIREFLNAQFAG